MRHYQEEFNCKILQRVSTETADTSIYLPSKDSTSGQKSKTKQNKLNVDEYCVAFLSSTCYNIHG